jgi:hypothetical protein
VGSKVALGYAGFRNFRDQSSIFSPSALEFCGGQSFSLQPRPEPCEFHLKAALHCGCNVRSGFGLILASDTVSSDSEGGVAKYLGGVALSCVAQQFLVRRNNSLYKMSGYLPILFLRFF